MHYAILRLAKGGHGVASCNGKTFFIDDALPGEEGEAEVVDEKPRYGFARVVRREVTSPLRALDDACPCARACDGCGFRHVKSHEALELKARAVLAEIAKASRVALPEPVFHALPGESLDGQRARVRLHLAEDGALGFYARGTHRVISACACPVMVPELRRAVSWMEADLRLARLPWMAPVDVQLDLDDTGRVFAHFKAGETGRGRKGRGARTGGNAVTFGRAWREWAHHAVDNEHLAGVRLGDREDGAGEKCLRATVAPDGLPPVVTWRRPGDFAQATGAANAIIHTLLDAFLVRHAPNHVADLFAGSGNLTFRAATRVPQVDGYELFCDSGCFERGLHDNASVMRDPSCVSLRVCDLTRALPSEASRAEMLICDPAREGLSAALCEHILSCSARALFYVSCEASCLARDLVTLSRGFHVEAMHFIDMFPQTPHVETVCILVRKNTCTST